MSEDLLPMFFDEEFVPHAYLDALFSAVGATATSDSGVTPSLSNQKYIQLLQQKSLTLLTHLDYYTNELTGDLENQIGKLHASNSVVSYSYETGGSTKTSTESDQLKPTTRLEYYIDSLSISVQSLNDTVVDVNAKMNELQTNDATTEKLLQLTKAKNNLVKVQQALETVKSIVEIAQDSRPPSPQKGRRSSAAPTSTKKSEKGIVVVPSELQNALYILQTTIVDQISERMRSEKETELDHELVEKIDDLSALLPVFKNLGEFYNVYSSFVKVIQSRKEEYLKLKNLDDELFDKVLK